MGYGGRLLGAITAGVNYIGTDPCIPTFEGLEKIRDDYFIQIKDMNYLDKVVRLIYLKMKV